MQISDDLLVEIVVEAVEFRVPAHTAQPGQLSLRELPRGGNALFAQRRKSDRAVGKFKLGGHIDPDLFDIFMWEKVYQKYAEQCMDAHQIDEIDLNKVPGYAPPPGA